MKLFKLLALLIVFAGLIGGTLVALAAIDAPTQKIEKTIVIETR